LAAFCDRSMAHAMFDSGSLGKVTAAGLQPHTNRTRRYLGGAAGSGLYGPPWLAGSLRQDTIHTQRKPSEKGRNHAIKVA
jgi:hypothetical protein